MERVRSGVFVIRVGDKTVSWSSMEVTSSAAPCGRVVIHGATVTVEVGDVVTVELSGERIFTGTVWVSVKEGDTVHRIEARSDYWKLHLPLEGAGWNDVTVREIVDDLGEKVGVRAEVDEAVAEAYLRRFSVAKGSAMIDVLMQFVRMLESRGNRDVLFYVDERNVLVVGTAEALRRETREVMAEHVMRADDRGAEVLPQVVLYTDEVAVGEKGYLDGASVVYYAKAGARQYVQVWGQWKVAAAVRESDTGEAEEEASEGRKEYIEQMISYNVAASEDLVIAALRGSGYFDDGVKRAVLKAGVIAAVYAAEEKRRNWNDGLPTIPNPWIRSVLGSALGGVAGGVAGVGTWLGIFAVSVNIPVALVLIGGATLGMALGGVAGGIGGAVLPDPNASVGRGQMTQLMFDDVMKELQDVVERYMSSLVGAGYIEVRYKKGELDDVNLFSGWVNFFTNERRRKFLEDCFVLSALALSVQRAWERRNVLNAKIDDVGKHRTMGDAVQFGIAKYKGIDMAKAQEDAKVYVNVNEVSDARYSVLVDDMKEDDVAYVEEVYEALK